MCDSSTYRLIFWDFFCPGCHPEGLMVEIVGDLEVLRLDLSKEELGRMDKKTGK